MFSVETLADITQEPVTTEEPVLTQEPVTTEERVISQEPVTTEEPLLTQEPVTTKEPFITQEPVTTKIFGYPVKPGGLPLLMPRKSFFTDKFR